MASGISSNPLSGSYQPVLPDPSQNMKEEREDQGPSQSRANPQRALEISPTQTQQPLASITQQSLQNRKDESDKKGDWVDFEKSDDTLRKFHRNPQWASKIVSSQLRQTLASMLPEPAQNLMLKALSIQRIYRDTHYTFTSAQAVRIMPINLLLQMLHEKTIQNYDPAHFQLLGDPNYKPEYTIDKYRSVKEVTDSNSSTRKDLISADVYLLSERQGESAIAFLVGNFSDIAVHEIKPLIKQIIKEWKPDIDLTAIEPEIEALAQLVEELKKDGTIPCGNLFTISIPKTMAKDCVYFAHPHGNVCATQPDSDRIENLQKGEFDPCPLPCKYNGLAPQARLFRPLLTTPKNGVRIVMFSGLPEERQALIKSKVQSLVNSILAKNS